MNLKRVPRSDKTIKLLRIKKEHHTFPKQLLSESSKGQETLPLLVDQKWKLFWIRKQVTRLDKTIKLVKYQNEYWRLLKIVSSEPNYGQGTKNVSYGQNVKLLWI